MDDKDWNQAALVHHSDGEISRDQVSKWLSGAQVPTHKNAIVAANVLGGDINDALRAAGFMTPDEVSAQFAPLAPVINLAVRNATRDLSDSDLLDELLRRARNRELPVDVGAWENNPQHAAADTSDDEQHLQDRTP